VNEKEPGTIRIRADFYFDLKNWNTDNGEITLTISRGIEKGRLLVKRNGKVGGGISLIDTRSSGHRVIERYDR